MEPDLPSPTVDPSIDDVLAELEHVQVRVPTTLRWELPDEGDPETDIVRTALVRLTQDFNITNVGVDGRFSLIALVPVNATRPDACGPSDPGGRAAFAARDGPAGVGADRLLAPFAEGWYHALVVGAPQAEVSLTFGDRGEADLFEPLMQDPSANVTSLRMVGTERAHEVTLEAAGRPWSLWAAHFVVANGFDGGRQHVLTVDPECAASVQAGGNNPFIGGERLVSVEVAGGPSTLVVRGGYDPRTDPLAPRETRLDVVFATFDPIELPAAPSLADANATAPSASSSSPADPTRSR